MSQDQEFIAEKDWIASLLRGSPSLDVRAGIEFEQGAIPGAVNLPILDTEERHRVGACYKQKGPAAALALGHELVSGEKKAHRLEAWRDFFARNPESYLYCFRGGQRSGITQAWLREAGVRVPRLAGGYKRARQFLLEALERESARLVFAVIGGNTGSGKTRLLHELAQEAPGVPQIDLERLARHRGSAFGKELEPQPAQGAFENELAVALLRLGAEPPGLSNRLPIWLEDESRMIGKVTLPEKLHLAMRAAPLYLIREPLEARARLILEEYVIDAFMKRSGTADPDQAFASLQQSLTSSILAISKKLGGLRATQLVKQIDHGIQEARCGRGWEAHLAWIEFLLANYYDPYYENHVRKGTRGVAFEGSRAELKAFISCSRKPAL